MCDEDRLRPSQMRVGGHQRVARAAGEFDECVNELCYRLLDHGNPPADVQPEIDGNLFVARAAGVQPAPGVADALDQLAFDECVNVFIAASPASIFRASSV